MGKYSASTSASVECFCASRFVFTSNFLDLNGNSPIIPSRRWSMFVGLKPRANQFFKLGALATRRVSEEPVKILANASGYHS